MVFWTKTADKENKNRQPECIDIIQPSKAFLAIIQAIALITLDEFLHNIFAQSQNKSSLDIIN